MLMVRFLKNSRHNLRDVLEAQGQNRGRPLIVSFAPFSPAGQINTWLRLGGDEIYFVGSYG
jgi:hypothetical protein